jgi:hypothetical protein
MITRSRRDRGILLATAICAAGAPLTAAAWLSARTAALADHAGAAGGVTARIGAVDADLTGTVRLSGVAFGELVAADSIEASVALDSLLAGTLRADEIRVAGPRIAIQVDGDGDSDLARHARRLMSHVRGAGDRGAAASRLRRIVVSSGTLSAHVAGLGELSADAVELVPDAGGVRVVTGAVRIDGHAGPLDVELRFSRSAAELTLPHVQLGRVLAVGGTGTVAGQPGAGARPAQPAQPAQPAHHDEYTAPHAPTLPGAETAAVEEAGAAETMDRTQSSALVEEGADHHREFTLGQSEAAGEPTGHLAADEPYGAGSASPAADGSGPADYSVKGDAAEMVYYEEGHPDYEQTRAEVWFESAAHAEAAGFRAPRRKRL